MASDQTRSLRSVTVNVGSRQKLPMRRRKTDRQQSALISVVPGLVRRSLNRPRKSLRIEGIDNAFPYALLNCLHDRSAYAIPVAHHLKAPRL